MSEMKIVFNQNEYLLSFFPIMQFLGHDSYNKRKVIELIVEYFSKSKDEFYETLIVQIDEEEIGSKYFKIIHISDLHDLEREISLSKGSLLYEYVLSRLNEFDFSEYNLSMEDLLNLIISTFNETATKSIGLELAIKEYPIASLIKAHLLISDNMMETYEKYVLLMNLIKEINGTSPTKWLVVCDNIDSYVSKEEYHSLVDFALKSSNDFDAWYIFCVKDNHYTRLNEVLMQGISIYNSEIIVLPPLYVLKEFIELNFPYEKQFDDEEILRIVRPILGDIGRRNEPLSLDSQVALKVFNEHYGIKTKPLENANKLALKYMHESSKMI